MLFHAMITVQFDNDQKLEISQKSRGVIILHTTVDQGRFPNWKIRQIRKIDVEKMRKVYFAFSAIGRRPLGLRTLGFCFIGG